MITFKYRCTPAAVKNFGAQPEVTLTAPEGYVPPPWIDLHIPCVATVSYYHVGMYSAKDLAPSATLGPEDTQEGVPD